MRRRGARLAAVLCLAAGCAFPQAPPAPKPPEPVRQLAFRDGLPAEAFARIATPGESARGTPPLAGVLMVVLRGDGEEDAARLAAGDFEPVLIADSGRGRERRRFFQLFARDTKRLTREEREELAQRQKALLSSRRAAGARDAAAAVSAFLHTNRREADEGVYGFEAEKDGGEILARILDAKGRPVAGRLAYLYNYDPELGEVRVAASDRSEQDGTISFHRLPPGHLYRVEVAPGPDGLAWSGVVRLEAGESEGLPTLVVTEPERRTSGLVLWQGLPAAGVRVRSVGPAQPTLSTTTDENGCYSLAPLREGEVVLSFSRADIDRDTVRVWRTRTGREEQVVPLDLLPASLKPR